MKSKLVILEFIEDRLDASGRKVKMVKAICECGKIKKYQLCNIKSNNTKSCGCLALRLKTTHGMKHTRIYQTWENMKKRCLKPKSTHYMYYGGRGITLCKNWYKFESFYKDMKNGYSDTLTLDRINSNKGYSKQNCRWVTMKEQNLNKRNTLFITFNNKRQSLKQWSEELNFDYMVLYTRLKLLNWSIEKAFTTPVLNQ